MTASDAGQLMITERTGYGGRQRNSSTTSDIYVIDTASMSISHQRNSSTTVMSSTTTMVDRHRRAETASAAVNWSVWQVPVDIYKLPDTIADNDDNNIGDDVLDGDNLKTKTKQQQFEYNASGTEGRSIYTV